MRRPPAIFTGFCSVLTDIAIMQAVITIVTYYSRGGLARLDPVIWGICAAAIYAVNYFLLRKSAPLPAIASVNAALLGLTLFALIYFAPMLDGFFRYVMTVVFAIITVIEAYRFSTRIQTLDSQLKKFDVYIILLGLQFIALDGGLPAADLPFFLIVLALGLISNLVLRAHEEDVGNVLTASSAGGIFFSIGLYALVAAVVYGCVRLLGVGARVAVETLFAAVRNALLAAFAAIDRFFKWLFSLLPYSAPQPGGTLDIGGSPAAEPDVGQIQFPVEVMYIIAALIALVIIAALVYFIIRYRKKRVSIKISAKAAPEPRIWRGRVSGKLKRRAKGWLADILFMIKSIRYINTPPGTLIRLERWGKKRGTPKKPGQSMREYLLALSPALAPMADELDRLYFGPGASCGPDKRCMPRGECRRIRREFYTDAAKRR